MRSSFKTYALPLVQMQATPATEKMKMRILARSMAREITAEEAAQVGGGGAPTDEMIRGRARATGTCTSTAVAGGSSACDHDTSSD